MNASKSDPAMNEAEAASHTEPIHAALLQAKVRQRQRYLLSGLFLLLGAFFILGMVVFSNGTIIEVHPTAAQNTAVVEVTSALGGSIGHTIYSLRGDPAIKVSATGFKALQKTLLPSETGGTLSVQLSELPGQLHLNTSPNSDNTRWFINGQMVMIAKALDKELFSGSYSIDIDSPYYLKKLIPIVIERGKVLDHSITLEPVSGQLSISTIPGNANIRINGEQLGKSPLSFARPGGAYHLEVTLGNYQTISEDIEITNAEHVIERNYRLAPRKAYINISLSPAGGVLLLNGKKVDSSVEKLAVQARVNNTLTYLKDGYFSKRKSITIAPGLEKKLSLHLKPESGVVDIRSKPQATVLIDGKEMGKTPLAIKLSAISHRIELHRAGYRSYKKNLTPTSKSTQKIRALLRTELQARLAESPKVLNNSVGMALKLFKPNDTFVMGAPRYEKGQRANEFLRTIKLDKPFYIGKYEVTGAQYARFRSKKGKKGDSLPSSGRKGETVPFLLPVSSVSWIEAAQYCNWLSRREKLTPFYEIQNHQLRGFHTASDGYRLPSEAEWEWLARKAAKSRQSKFTWGDATTIPAKSGNIADEYAKGKTTHYVPNYSDGYAGVAPVGSYPADKNGLYDLTGNVSEWVHDVYSLLPPDGQKTEVDPLGKNTGDTHTVKGSNWRSGTITELRASFREGASTGRDDIGFRVARYVYGR